MKHNQGYVVYVIPAWIFAVFIAAIQSVWLKVIGHGSGRRVLLQCYSQRFLHGFKICRDQQEAAGTWQLNNSKTVCKLVSMVFNSIIANTAVAECPEERRLYEFVPQHDMYEGCSTL